LTPDAVRRARAAHPVLGRILYLNTGTKGLTAAPVVEALGEMTRRVELDGYPGYRAVMAEADAALRRLAALLGAGPDELAFTGNASVSLNYAARCLPWDDLRLAPRHPPVVLISDHEYPTTERIFAHLEATGRCRRVRFRLSPDWAEMRASLDEAFDTHARVLVASHVCCNTGMRADAAALAAWCRERGVISVLDGAQAVGQFPIALTEIGCDLYVTNGHKWLFGPNGVGLLYVRREFAARMEPFMVAAGAIDYAADPAAPGFWRAGAARFDVRSAFPVQTCAAMNAALDWLESLGGLTAVEERQRALTAHVKARLDEMPDRFRPLTPPGWEHSSALATVRMPGRSGAEIERFCVRLLDEGKAWLRPVPEFDGLRLSMAYYNDEDEYERLFALVAAEGFA
jgi:selenocysteine lyase/cysteine desulfurase